jgi:hypothetical protein
MRDVNSIQINVFRLDEQDTVIPCIAKMKRCLFSQAFSSVATVRLDLIKIRHGYCLQLLFKVRLPRSSSWPLQVYNMTCNVKQKLVKDLFV